MDIRDLKVFQMIAFEKSVTKAAKKLYMTPQGVSKILKNLETEMGSQLFVRDKNGMHLTESGECFLVYANQDIEEYYEMKQEILHIEQRQQNSGRSREHRLYRHGRKPRYRYGDQQENDHRQPHLPNDAGC